MRDAFCDKIQNLSESAASAPFQADLSNFDLTDLPEACEADLPGPLPSGAEGG